MHEHLFVFRKPKENENFQELRGQLKNNRARDPEINSGLNTQLTSSKTLLSHQKVWKVLLPAGCVRPTMPDRVEVSTKVGSRLARLVGEARRVKDGFFQILTNSACGL